jgi:hypothetical protein
VPISGTSQSARYPHKNVDMSGNSEHLERRLKDVNRMRVTRSCGMAVIVAVISLTACGSPGEETTSGDGVLDSADGQVAQGTGVTSSASTEREVVEAALAEWADSGAEIVEFPDWTPPSPFHPIGLSAARLYSPPIDP